MYQIEKHEVDAGTNISLSCGCSNMGILNVAGCFGEVKDGIGIVDYFSLILDE